MRSRVGSGAHWHFGFLALALGLDLSSSSRLALGEYLTKEYEHLIRRRVKTNAQK
jgi:hypothetical protein